MRNKNLFVLIHIRNMGKVGAGPQVNIYFTDRSKALLLLWIFFIIAFHVSHAVLSVPCSLVVTCYDYFVCDVFLCFCHSHRVSWAF